MTLRLAHTVFLAFVVTTAAVVVIMLVTQRLTFQSGFREYVDRVETSRLEILADELESRYAEEGNWGFIAGAERWPPELVIGMLPSRFGRPGEDMLERMRRGFGQDFPGVRPPPGLRFGAEQRPVVPWQRAGLYDTSDEWIGGPKVQGKDLTRLAIRSGDDTVGYLLIERAKSITNALDLQFQDQQRRALYPASIVIVLVAALAAALMTRNLTRPIRELDRGASRLAAGRYDARIELDRRDELGRLAGNFNVLARTLEENRAARQQWGADISHELRTPVAALKSELEVLEEGLRPVNAEALRSLSAEVDRLGSLISDLYELSRSEAGTLSYDKAEVDLNTLLE